MKLSTQTLDVFGLHLLKERSEKIEKCEERLERNGFALVRGKPTSLERRNMEKWDWDDVSDASHFSQMRCRTTSQTVKNVHESLQHGVNHCQPVNLCLLGCSSSELCKLHKKHQHCKDNMASAIVMFLDVMDVWDVCGFTLLHSHAFTDLLHFRDFVRRKCDCESILLKYAFVMVGRATLRLKLIQNLRGPNWSDKVQSAKQEASKANQKRVIGRRTVTIALQQIHQTKRTKRAIASVALWHDSPTTGFVSQASRSTRPYNQRGYQFRIVLTVLVVSPDPLFWENESD